MCTDRVSCIVPPHLLETLLDNDDARVREAAINTLLSTEQLRGQRMSGLGLQAATVPAGGRRTIFDLRQRISYGAAIRVRSETDAAVADQSVNRAFDGLGATRELFAQAFGRDSIDGAGMRLDAYVHRGVHYNNAFWDGQRMVFGDGDGVIFGDFTGSIDIVGHELAHGVTEHTAGLEYHNQSGALNESMSDVFGSLVKQWSLRQTAVEADWRIGAEVFTPDFAGDALRSMSDPGNAYNNPQMGKDPQPAHMGDYVHKPDTPEGDNGGVHINSGIPNKAFHLVATAIGGNAWEAPGHIWYQALGASRPDTDFQEFADATYTAAGQLCGKGSREHLAVGAAWEAVGIIVVGGITDASVDGAVASLSRQVEDLAAMVRALREDLRKAS